MSDKLNDAIRIFKRQLAAQAAVDTAEAQLAKATKGMTGGEIGQYFEQTNAILMDKDARAEAFQQSQAFLG